MNKYEEIRRQTVNEDWTAEVIADATLDDLDKDAIEKAREGYKQRYPNLAEECDGWDDKVFLDKACLTIGGKITRATLLLVGKETSAHKLNHIAQIVWKCFQDGQVFGDIYTIPFIRTTSELLGRIRNYRFKIYPWDVLSDQLNDKQKINKIDYILKRLRIAEKIHNETKGNDSFWSLGKT